MGGVGVDTDQVLCECACGCRNDCAPFKIPLCPDCSMSGECERKCQEQARERAANQPLPTPPPARTLGEKRVGLRFNPSGSLAVDIIKREGADLIDIINDLGGEGNSQFVRWKSEALTCIETGIMYAVKAATAGMEPEDG